MLVQKSEIRDVHGLSDKEEQGIMDFLQGAVYCWCKNKPRDDGQEGSAWFAARDLIGGTNYYWQRTPLYVLYEKSNGDEEQAGKDAGWILKKVIDKDKRHFETKKEGMVRQYRWNGKADID